MITSDAKMANILIVEDDDLIHKVLERILTIGGHKVIGHAMNGIDAIEQYEKSNPRPDIILMDQRMPIMSGTEATEKILRIEPRAKVLFVSADERSKKKAESAGAVGFLTKPIRSQILYSAIQQYTRQ
jgi:two-component system chemotaxis response regulator CheY